jgi:hypothetical protein
VVLQDGTSSHSNRVTLHFPLGTQQPNLQAMATSNSGCDYPALFVGLQVPTPGGVTLHVGINALILNELSRDCEATL